MNKFFRVLRDPIVGDGGGSATITTPPATGAAPASASGTVVLPTAGTPTAGTPPAFSVPDQYKDKPYAKTIDSPDKLWSMLDGAQELIGKRPAGIPAPEAPQAEWDKFYEAAGRPKTAAEYAFDYGKDDKGLPKASPDPKFDESIKQMMFEEGVTAKQAAGLQKKFDGIVANLIKDKNIQVQQQNEDFSKTATELFGAERDKVLANGKALLADNIKDPRIQSALSKLPNDALMVLASALKSFSDKYIKPGGGNPPATPAGGAGGGKAEMTAEARRLMTTPEYTNSMHPDNAKVLARVNQLYIDASKLSG